MGANRLPEKSARQVSGESQIRLSGTRHASTVAAPASTAAPAKKVRNPSARPSAIRARSAAGSWASASRPAAHHRGEALRQAALHQAQRAEQQRPQQRRRRGRAQVAHELHRGRGHPQPRRAGRRLHRGLHRREGGAEAHASSPSSQGSTAERDPARATPGTHSTTVATAQPDGGQQHVAPRARQEQARGERAHAAAQAHRQQHQPTVAIGTPAHTVR
jgi:hypothetical protein